MHVIQVVASYMSLLVYSAMYSYIYSTCSVIFLNREYSVILFMDLHVLRICMHGSYSFNFFHECKVCYQCTQHLTITPIVHVCIPIISSASSCDSVN